MKKNYFMLAATTMMLAACAQTDVVNEVNMVDEPQAIGFETFAQKLTRAENNQTDYSDDLEKHHTSFNVYAGKSVKGATQAVYSNTSEGTVNFGNSSWTASPLKYWDKTATEYYFYAGAPANAAWEFAMTTADDYSTGYLEYPNFSLAGENLADGSNTRKDSWKDDRTTNDVDLMIAAPKTVVRADYNKTSPDVVNMQFNHILSRLNILVKKGNNIASDQELKLKSLDVFNLKSIGSFDESKKIADQTPMIDRWTIADDAATYTLSAATVSDKIEGPIYTHQYLVIPQAVNFEEIDTDGSSEKKEVYFRIEYTIDSETYYAFYNLAAAFGQNVSLNFQEGWENTLTITINPNAIQFDANASTWQTYVNPEKIID